MTDSSRLILEVHLREYDRLTSEMRGDQEMIDRYVTLYLTAFFALIAFLLRPGGVASTQTYLDSIRKSPDLVFLALVIPIINSVLMIRIAHLTTLVFARAQYLAFTLRPAISEISEAPRVMRWDQMSDALPQGCLAALLGFDTTSADLPAKRISQWMRPIPGAALFTLATGASVVLLVLLTGAATKGPGVLALCVAAWAVTIVAVGTALATARAGVSRP